MLKNKSIKYSLVICISMASMSQYASADFNIYADPSVVAKKVKKQDKYSFKQIGGSLEKSKVVKNGYAPLNIAIKHLVPEGWDIKMASGIGLEDSIVKWKGNVTWPYALESISLNHDMDMVVNWKRRYVSIDSKVRREDVKVAKLEKIEEQHNLKTNLLTQNEAIKTETNESIASNSLLAKEADKLELNKVEKMEDNKKVESKEKNTLDLIAEKETMSVEQKIAEMSPKEKYELTKEYESINILPLDTSFNSFVENKDIKKHEYMQLTYILKAGKSLQENIREWANLMPKGWTVEWDAKKDFLIHKDIEFKNTFIDVFPEVELLYKNSKYPVEIELYIRNNTIHVFNKEYKINHKGAKL